ncbi:MAG: hypothetical protein NVS3B20_11080 [Polyangiales bacterium]
MRDLTATVLARVVRYVGRCIRWASVALFIVQAGCPSSGMNKDKPSEVCIKTGEKCTFAPGKLGVCTEVEQGGCANPPCFICASQH